MNDIKLYLAPMAGAADAPLRIMCEKYGADGTTSEMVSAAAVWYGDRKTFSLAEIAAEERSCAVQIFGHEPEKISYAVKVLYERAGIKPRAFDINMGCPVKKVVSGGDGSALMKDLLLAGRIIEAAVKASPVPVTVKMRTGWDREHINCKELCRIAEQTGASGVCVHGRTKQDMYLPGTVDMNAVAEARAAVGIPFTANGDITDGQSAKRALEITGADSLMIGRASLGDPFVFGRIRAYLEGKPYREPADGERISAAKEHFMLMLREKGENTAVREGRKQMAWYTKGMYGSASYRQKMNAASSADEMIHILENIKEDTQL